MRPEPKSGAQTKEAIVDAIAARLGIDAPRMSTGSTEPKEIFVLISDVLGLQIDSKLDKPGMAKAIVESAGYPWLPEFESRGSTITRKGLLAVQHAVDLFLG
jgi:hypothetical protein